MDAVHRAGVDKIFGVPGDFNLAFLDDIDEPAMPLTALNSPTPNVVTSTPSPLIRA
jgi:hypothetical protein